MYANDRPFFRRSFVAALVHSLLLMATQAECIEAVETVELELYPAEQAAIEMCPAELGSLEIGIRNSGPHSMVIRRIVHNAGCNCIQVRTFSPVALGPGQTARVKLDIDTTGKHHDFEVIFRVVTDANETLEVKNRLKVKILADISLSQALLEVGEVLAHAALENSITVRLDPSIDANSIALGPFHQTDEFKWAVRGEGHEGRGSELSGYALEFAFRAPQEPGKFEESFYLSITHGEGRIRKFKISVAGKVVPEISLNPGRLFLGYVKPGAVITKTVELLAKTQEPFEVIGVESDSIRIVDHAVESVSPTSKKIHISLQVGQESSLKIMKTPIRILLKMESGTTEMELPCIYTLARKP